MESVRKNVVALVKEQPAGIPLKKLVQHYQQKYHQNLTFSTLGFDSVRSLIASLDSELVIVGQRVTHKDHLCNNQVGAADKSFKLSVLRVILCPLPQLKWLK